MSPSAGAQSPPGAPVRMDAAAGMELFLEVTVNGVRAPGLAGFTLRGKAWWTRAATLRALGLRFPGGDPEAEVALDTLPGLDVAYDAARQRISLLAPVELLNRPEQALRAAEGGLVTADAPLPSLLLSYDLYGQRSRGAGRLDSLGAWTEVRVSGVGPGAWESTALGRAVAAPGVREREMVRLDSRWQLDDPVALRSLTVGDVSTGALAWTRSTRLGGLRLARNFGLQPYLSTAPSALVRGEAVLPSTVDLYINGLRQVSRPVQPGAFTVEGAPMLNGAGQARLVVTDINGQQRVIDFPLYGAPQLLREGWLDGSVEVGAVREDYGLRSFAYGGAMASGTGRYGWSDQLTLEGHAEADAGTVMAGSGGTVLLPGGAGALSLAGAASRHGAGTGGQANAGYQWSRGPWSLGLASLRRSGRFRDVASGYGAVLPQATDQLFAGTSTDWGSFGLGYVRQRHGQGDPSRLANFSWTTTLPRSASLGFSAVRDLEGGTTYLSLSLHVPLDGGVALGAGARRAGGAGSVTLAASRSAPGDVPGWGWRTEAGGGGQRSALGELTRLGDHGRWSAGVGQQQARGATPATTTTFGAASGALLWAAGRGFAVPRVDEAFALVSTDGIPDVPVHLENREVGRTDAAGLLLVRGLRPYERNRLSVSPLTLNPDVRLDSANAAPVPPGRAGVAARFSMRHVLAMQFVLHDQAGQPVPAGSRAWIEAPGTPRRPLIVGYDGLVYVEDPPAGARVFAGSDGPACVARLPATTARRGMVDAGLLVCRRQPEPRP